MFLSKLTDVHSKLFGLTVLYIPKEAMYISVDEARQDKELIKRLEAIVVYWTKQIRVGLQDQDQSTPDDLLCPIDEYDFWVYRCKSNVKGQVFAKDVEKMDKVYSRVMIIKPFDN